MKSQARGTLALAILIPLALLLRTQSFDHARSSRTYEDLYYLPSASWLKVFSLGYREALADLMWTRALVYVGEEFQHQGQVAHIFSYLDTLLELDPDFEDAYRWAPTLGLYRPTEVSVEDIDHAVAILDRGVARFPNSGRMAWTLGATLAFELAPRLPIADPRRDEVRTRGAEQILRAVALGGAPSWAALSGSSILASVGQMEAAATRLEGLYGLVDDDNLRAQIAARIADVRSAAYGEALENATLDLEADRARRHPYVHPGLHFLLWSPPAQALDLTSARPFGSLIIDQLAVVDE